MVVDYLGLADQLKQALATYTDSGGQGDPTYDMQQAIAIMLEKHGIACDMLHGFSWDKWTTGTPAEQLGLIPAGQEHILEQDDGKQRFVQVVMELSRAFALCAASDEATAIRDDVSFSQAIQAALNKQQSPDGRTSPEQIDAAVRQLVSKAITTDGHVIDVFTAAGLPKPDIGILSEQFLAEVRGLKHKNVAAELITQVRKSVTIDWTLREGARARIRVMVKRILNKYGYPPDLQEAAVKTVLQQAELLCAEWA